MFNKIVVFRKEKPYLIYKSKPKLQKSHNMKKSITNLKISFAMNTNNSENNSNINLKTSSNSKLNPDSESIRKVQTHTQPILKKSLFDEKEKDINQTNQTSRKFSSIKSHNIITNYYDISLSAKTHKHINRSKFYSRTQENDGKNNAYYLTGKLPFRDKYIVEINNYNFNTPDNNDNKSKNKIITNKNEFIQCESININNDNNRNNNNYNYNYSYNTLKNNMLNMRRKDKKIDKLAKKLVLKLNSEDKKKNKTKCCCGNLITLNNGFFNGVNLVMSYSPLKQKKEYNKMTINDNTDNNNQDNNKLEQQEAIYSNGYNFIPTNLPLFLREKYNIKGTSVLSPFCIEARDEFLFKKIFYEGEKKKFLKKDVIDNKFNIFYAENQNQYDKNLVKFNAKLKLKGRRILHEVGPTPTEKKLNKIKNKMDFMKKIVDYAYPNMVLAKVRESERVCRKKSLSEINLPPFKKAELTDKQNNKFLGDYLRQSIKILKHK